MMLRPPATAAPAFAAVQEPLEPADRAVLGWLLAALFASIFLQRFGVPLGRFGIGMNLLVTFAALAAIGARGALQVDPLRAALVCLFVACALVSAALNAPSASAPSVALLVALCAPYALWLRRPASVFVPLLRGFQWMVLVCAVAGITQFLAQFVVDPALIFTFQGLLPEPILLKGWGNMQPLYYGSTIYKANGFFLNEPSVFSQYLALAIVVEVLFFGRIPWLATFGVGLMLSYSGTGLIPLLLLLPWLLLFRRAYKALLGLLALAVAAVALGDLWNMQALVARVAEFGASGSSASARYQAGGWLLAAYVLPWPPDLLFGLGPGSFLDHALLQSYEAHDATVWKVLFEYGLVGAAAYLLLMGVVFFDRAPSRWLSAALAIGFFTFGGTMLDTRLHVLILLFCALTKRAVPVPGPAPAPAMQAGPRPRMARAEAR